MPAVSESIATQECAPVAAPTTKKSRAPRPARAAGTNRSAHEWRVYAAIAVAVAIAWQLGKLPMFDPRTETGYWVGVVGGSMMLLLFAYPLRKRFAFMARLGTTRLWFVVHMVLGVFGPVIVLAHSGFHIGSLNAGVALVSMLVVALSGVAGRFIYLHVHRGLGGEHETLQNLQAQLGLLDDSAVGGLAFAPQAQAAMRDLHRHVGQPQDRFSEHLRRLTVMPLQLMACRRDIRAEVRRQIRRLAEAEGWPPETLERRLRKALGLVDEHVAAVQRVAQFAAYARALSFWHVLHVPFVVMMVVCAIVHVVAVHAY
ncbi:MAG: hypothetical protein JNL85_12010 [Rubrivivax sp.]|nr:hypothetical protein [Rubrivivax sp.]